MMGQRFLEQAFTELSRDYKEVPSESMEALLEDLNYKTRDDLLYAVGIGEQMPMVIAKRLVLTQEGNVLEVSADESPLAIKGTEGMVVHFAKCCQPIPGDNILGLFQQGHGILVHASDCAVVNQGRTSPEQFVSMRWDDQVQGEFWVDITVEVANERGMMGMLATSISETDSNIGNISVDPRDGRHNTVTFSISVQGRNHVARVMRRLRANKKVTRLYRKKQGDS